MIWVSVLGNSILRYQHVPDAFCGSQVTLILYALRVALPAVALCVCRQLEIVSSTLDVSYDPRNKYFTSGFHYVMCLVIPVVYAILRKFQKLRLCMVYHKLIFFDFPQISLCKTADSLSCRTSGVKRPSIHRFQPCF